MHSASSADVYSPAEVARAAGAPESQVLAAMGGARGYIRHADAVSIGRALQSARQPLFSLFLSPSSMDSRGVPLVLSSTVYAALLLLAVVVASLGTTPKAAVLQPADRSRDLTRLVFLATPGPGGGGGGGGLRERVAAPAALREGDRAVSSPALVPQPKPAPLPAEPLPVVIAPIITSPADARNRTGVLDRTTVDVDSQGSGENGGAGAGSGAGLGDGTGRGIGDGSGGGTGGGPYRAGSGVEPPKLLREVKADYTEDARRRSLTGDVVLEIVVRRDGSVGDVRILQGLGGGLNERAVEAVRQWRFSPARRLGTPVDVIVEVAVEFKLR